jgi:hypothetical protein
MADLTMDAGLTLLHWRLSECHGTSIGWRYPRSRLSGKDIATRLNVLTAI